jgi:hypothetical protein
MLYRIILFRSSSGKSLVDLVYEEAYKNESYMANFFSAINHFSKAYLTEENLSLIQFNDLFIRFSYCEDLDLTIMIIFDKKILGKIDDLIERIKEIAIEYEPIIREWNSVNMKEIDIIKDPLLQVSRRFLFSLFLKQI